MGNLRLYSSVLVIGTSSAAVIVACSSNNKGTVDAPPIVLIDAKPDAPKVVDGPPDAPPRVADLSCLTTPIPTTTTATTVTLSGSATTISQSGGSDVEDATVTAKNAAGVTITATGNPTQTGSAGAAAGAGTFTITLSTGGNAVDVHLVASKTGLRDDLVYPQHPLIADQANIPLLMLDPSTFGLLSQLGGATSEGSNAGALIVAMTDCAGQSVENGTLQVQQNGSDVGEIRYTRPFMGFPAPNASAASTDNTGAVFVFNVPAADGGTPTTLVGKVAGMSFRAKVVSVYRKSNTTAALVP